MKYTARIYITTPQGPEQELKEIEAKNQKEAKQIAKVYVNQMGYRLVEMF